jgi:uncharacterized membrane protein
MTRLSALAPAIAMLLPCAGYTALIGVWHGPYAAGMTVAAMLVPAACFVAFGPRYSRPVRAAGRGEGL